MLEVDKIHYMKKDGMNRLLYELVKPYAAIRQMQIAKPQWDQMTDALRANVRARMATEQSQGQASAEMYGLILQPFKANGAEMSLPLSQDILVRAKDYGGPQALKLKRMQKYSYTSRTYSLVGNGHAVDVRQLLQFENAKDSTRKIMTGLDVFAIRIQESQVAQGDKLAMFLRTCPSSQDQPYACYARDPLRSLMMFNLLKDSPKTGP